MIKKWLSNHAHWQNLNEDREGNIKGSILWDGRAWFRPWGYGTSHRRPEIHWSWCFPTSHCMAEIDVGAGDCNDGVNLTLACWLFFFSLTIEGILPKWFLKRGCQKALKTEWMGYEYMAWPRRTGIRFFDKTIWFDIWDWDAGWDCRQPKWMAFNFDIPDFFLGKAKYNSKSLTPIPIKEGLLIPGEGIYPVEITLTEDSWERPRWPWPTVIRRAQIECKRPIPEPGKGENSWDCGENATYGLTTPASSAEEALQHLRDSVMSTRERYGGKNWKPDRATI